MKLIPRIKRFWQLSNKDPEVLKKFEKLTVEDLQYIPEIGDGKAVFFGEGTDEEKKQQDLEDKGLRGIFGL